jgi:hypothetical protein
VPGFGTQFGVGQYGLELSQTLLAIPGPLAGAMFMTKVQFQSAEKLRVRLPPFLNKTDWSYIMGTDVATITVKCPDGTVLVSGVGGVPAAVWDSDTKIWSLDLAVSYYTAHHDAATNEWKIYATSDDADYVPQWASYFWGDYVDDITATKTTVGTPAHGTIAGDIANVESDMASYQGETLTAVAAIQTVVDTLQNVAIGKWVIDTLNNQLVLSRWDTGGGGHWVEFQRFDLFDKDGNPSSSQIYARVPS